MRETSTVSPETGREGEREEETGWVMDDGWTDGRVDGWMMDDGYVGRWMMDGQTDGRVEV